MSAVREDVGALSATEAELTYSAMRMRSHYDLMVVTTTKARDELRSRLQKGLRAIEPLPGGGYDGLVALDHRDVCRLVNAYAWANRCLYNAAMAVCDVEELPDDGIAEGIVWEVTL